MTMSFITKKTIGETFLARIKESPNRVAFRYKSNADWKDVTFREFHDRCALVSFGLMGLGVKKGEKVAILSHTRLEWSLCDMAILGAGAITIPIYPSNTPEDVEYILNHSEASVVILEDAVQLRKVLEKRAANSGALPNLRNIVVMEPSAMALSPQSASSPRMSKDILTLDALFEIGRRQEAKDPTRFEANLTEARPDDLITICYTSGTTGVPKGAMITQDNMMSVLEDCVAAISGLVKPENETLLSFLPYSHILGKFESMAIYSFGWKSAFAESLDKLPANFLEIHPTVVFAVPRIFEKAFNRISAELAQKSPFVQKLVDEALNAGREYREAHASKRKPKLLTTLAYQLARNALFAKVKEGFGGHLKFAVCGGAPLPKEIGEFFDTAGIRILEGYGLTETCAPVALNDPEAPVFGCVGKPLPEVTLKIASDGEILVKSRKVFAGYYKMPAETAEAIENGCFHTGDIGVIDDQGRLKITDRKKDLIITSAGKNVAPQKIENLAKAKNLISQFVVHGDRRNYLTALVTLDRQQVIHLASENQILFSEYSELIKNSKILAIVQKLIDEVNEQLASFETIKKFVILPDEFSVESGELTPSLKVRRRVVEKKFKTQLDSMYA